MANNCEDCGEDTTYNPKKGLRQMYRFSSTFQNLSSPVEDEIRDFERLPHIFGVLPIVPFFDDSDATLRFLRLMASLSPTRGACIENMGDYILGAGLKATQYRKPGLSIANVERLSTAAENAVFDFVQSWNPDSTPLYMQEAAAAIYDNLSTFGNVGVEVVMSSVGGVKSLYYTPIDAEKFRYISPNTMKNHVAVSPLWTAEYVNRYPPKIISVYPDVEQLENGDYRTFIHVKNKKTGRDLYGLPQAYPSIYYQYMEYQLGDFSTKGYGEGWTGKMFFETAGDLEDDNTSDDTEEFRSNLRNTFTNDGKARRIMHRHRAAADPATEVHEFKDDKSHEFHLGMAEVSEKQIVKSHNWHYDLLGVPTPGRLGNSDFKDIYMVKQKTVIRPYQDWVMQPINQVYELAQKWFEAGDPATLALDDLFVFTEEVSIANANTNPQQP